LFPTLFIIGWRYAIKDAFHAWPLAVYPFFYFLTFAFANPLIFRWYLTPPLPMYFLGIFLGVAHLDQQVGRRLISTLVLVGAFILTLSAWTLHPDHGLDRPAPEMAYIKLEGLYRQAAALLAPEIDPGDTIAAGDIGVLGYFTGARILDTVGLISLQSSSFYPLPPEEYTINYAIPSELILQEQPEYLVSLEAYIRKTLLHDDRFEQDYLLLYTLDTDIYGSRGMMIFKRR
jgi:hypothetical protein